MPSTTTKKRGNQRVIKFKNNGELEINDVIHDEVFDLELNNYIFTLQAKSNSWRFGIRLFKSDNIPFSTESRHINEGNIDIQVAVGTWYKPENYWENPNRIELGQYNIESIDHVIDRFDEYKDLDKVEFSIGRDSSDTVNVVYKTGKHRATKNLPISSEFRYFKIFAWADKIEFDIDCVVKVKNKMSRAKQPPKQREANQQYWFLKLSPDSWNVTNLIEGAETWFGTYLPKTGEKRPEYNLFSSIKPGDYTLGYAVANHEAVVCVFKVTEAIHSDQAKGEIISLVVDRQISPPVHYTNFRDLINFADELVADSPLRLFAISEPIFRQILQSEAGINRSKEFFLPAYSTEGNHLDTDDQLQFANDIESFATVISLRDVKPPLAIGLFGNWGSGKSFFMEKLEQQIDMNCEAKDPKFIEHVVQVKFNSWHYTDTNLWASLTTQIFESLNDYAQRKQYGEKAIEAVYKELELTNVQIGETKKKIQEAEFAVEKLEEQKKEVEQVIEEKKEKLQLWNTSDLIAIVLKDPTIQADFKSIKEQFKNEELIDNLNELDARISEVRSTGDKLVKTFQIFRKNRKGNWWMAWALFLLLLAAVYLLTGPYDFILNNAVNAFVRIIATITLVTAGITKLYPYFRRVILFYNRAKSLKDTIEQAKQIARIREHDEKDRLTSEIGHLNLKKQLLEKEKSNKENDREKLRSQLADVGSGKLLAHFLAGKSTDDSYVKQLGIVSWIRKDFSKLNELFIQQNKVEMDQGTANDRIKIDRIILYIDDLDRCNEDIVVKVLEAIHLLLAFPLFVVVVGVDPRWLDNALSEKYKTLFGKKDDQESKAINIIQYGKPASSFDYLEKIFQIPFSLKPIDKEGREDLLSYLVRNEMAIPNVQRQNSQESKTANHSESKVEDTDNETSPNVLSGESIAKDQDASEKISQLVFQPQELEFMQEISALFGHTPRTINRYVNIYRIIKAHRSFNTDGSLTESEFRAVMLTLGIVVGCPEDAEQFIKEIHKSKNKSLLEFLKGDHILVSLSEFIKSNIRQQILASITPTMIRRNLNLVARFSFRPILLEGI